jgi:succinate dehydrogenase/fumarate reductase flavoprotein subunit
MDKNEKKSLSRRDFIKSTAVIAGTGLIVGCTPRVKTEEPLPSQPTSVPGSTEAMTAADVTNKWAFEIPPAAIEDSSITETKEAEIIVVGAGTAGLVAANKAAEDGAKVILISASSAPIFRGGSNDAVYSKAKERLGLEKTDSRLIAREIVANGNYVDQKKWYNFYNNSEEAMNWLIDIMEGAGYETGIEQGTAFLDGSPYFQALGAHGWMTAEAHAMGNNQKFVVDTLAERLQEKGGEIFYKTIARQLVRGGVANGTSGRVEAVIAEAEGGKFVKYVGTKAIVLATGDFSANKDMMYKYCPFAAPIIKDEVYNEQPNYDKNFQYGGLFYGDGQKMGLWIGAAWQKIFPCTPMGGGVGTGPGIGTAMFSGLLVNRDGERYMCEYGMRDMGALTNTLEPERKVFAIWDAGYAQKFESKWFDRSVPYGEDSTLPVDKVVAGWDANVEKGSYFKADTLEGLIEAMGLPASTIDTINRYNELAKAGEDADFHKDPSLLFPIETGPFYGSGPGGVFLTVCGGLRTNVKMQVCDETDHPIDGLYNIGTMVGDMYFGNYTFEIPGLNLGATCVTFGYLTGRDIAKAA